METTACIGPAAGRRGSQYTSAELHDLCTKLVVRQSMGRTGVCWDNALAESS
ncbi:MAG: hypothetical protein LC118_13740 [Dehalococcoidia bacterium]|nr:hypothetical protein [Dehalococcoidia bacterium]